MKFLTRTLSATIPPYKELKPLPVLWNPGLKRSRPKPQIFLPSTPAATTVFSVLGSRMPFGSVGGTGRLRAEWQRRPRQRPRAHRVRSPGARLAPPTPPQQQKIAAPQLSVGRERVRSRACHSGGSGYGGCHQRALITSGLIIWSRA